MPTMAEIFFDAAGVERKPVDGKSGDEGSAEARRLFSMALDLFKQYMLRQTGIPADDLRSLRTRVTCCLRMTGRLDEAIRSCDWLYQEDPDIKIFGSSWEELADCFAGKAAPLPRGGARLDLLNQADCVYARLAARLRHVADEHAYRLLLKHAEILLETDPDALRRLFIQYGLRGYAPEWDGDRWGCRSRMEALRKKLDAVAPLKKT